MSSSNRGKATTFGSTTSLPASTSGSGSGSRDGIQKNIITSESFDDDDTESDIFESLPPSPDAEEFSWGFSEPDPLPSPKTDRDPEPSRPSPPSSRSPSPLPLPTFKSGPFGGLAPKDSDSSCPVKGMYRLLDLITEQGSSGLVDKIVIAQESLQAFINALSPGAYSSITTVNFKILDNIFLKPIGVYGSKEEIVRFFREMGAIDVETARQLLVLQHAYTARGADPILRSGLYIIRTFTSTAEEQTYVLYWPEDSSWDDKAVSTVQHNRVMFMRYLTKLCDQLVCLLSAEHSQAIVWRDEVNDLDDARDDASKNDSDDEDRLFTFTVAESNEQEENVKARQGFTMNSPRLVSQPPPPKMHIDPSVFFPRLLYGETMQGFMTAHLRPARSVVERFSHDHQSASQIRLLFEDDVVLCLSETLEDKALETLMRTISLGTRFPKEYESWENRRREIDKLFQKRLTERQTEIHQTLEQASGGIQATVRGAAIGEILKAFPMLRRDGFSSELSSADSMNSGEVAGTLRDLFSIYPKAESTFRGLIRAANLEKGIKGTDFQSKKDRTLRLDYLLDNQKGLKEEQIRSLADAILVKKDKQTALGLLQSFTKEDQRWYSEPWGGGKSQVSKEEALWRNSLTYASKISDSVFLSHVKTKIQSIPVSDLSHDIAADCEKTAYECLSTQLDSLASGISQQILSTQKEELNSQVQRELKSEEDKELKVSRAEFVRRIEDLCRERSGSRNSIHIDHFKTKKEHHYAADSYSISGRKETLQNPGIEYKIHVLCFFTDQKHNLQLDPTYVPIPVLNDQLSHSFHIPSDTLVKYAHLLEGDRILLGLVDSQGNVAVLLDRLSRIDAAIQSRSHLKFLHQDKIGQTCLFAYDESKRMLAVYASARMQLHIFVFDGEFKSLRGIGTAIDLMPFYNQGVSITHACFVHGSEEIFFIDSSAQARICSLISLQLRPASLQLTQIPRAIYSAPDGSCVLVVQDEDGERTITAYHWSTFASTRGICVTLPDFPVGLDAALLTSIINRSNIHLVGLDLDTQSCRSVILDITRNATEFGFEDRRPKGSSVHGNQTVHNCLINCHSDVWTRFPIVPAVKRQTITSSSKRQQKALVFVTDDHRRPFSSHFADLISAFERTSRKPIGDELKNIQVSARPFPPFAQEFLSSPDWPVSRFRAGEWLADLLCLVPIHIAITHENRFVPLKDGVVSPELEKSFLGAEVNRIVDSLTFGWYESIFQSYWASKPVKVVSSMGEQSIGKSFTLNHLVDSSFAGSAHEMRTTEGVWMSVLPTEEAIIVALDFEGVHSLERSAQEETLLFLFNTAISNLILHRIPFALSRDITSGLSQTLQSSSSLLDQMSDPSLFQSTLVVIIKDVIDSGNAAVKRDSDNSKAFNDPSLRTRLPWNAGKLEIIPWPVIDSREFYKLFSAVKKKLDEQRSSHRTAGEFLHTLKILMAKLNAYDWGATSMSQTMAAHRANSLLAILPIALETGYSEVVPGLEPLKGFDTDLVIEAEDTEARFILAGPDIPAAEREHYLSILRNSWDQFGSRQHVDDSEWTSDLVQHLTRLVDLRVAHVEKWLKSNLQRFQAEHASLEDLHRTFDSAVFDLRAGIQLCKSQCATCNLLCIQSLFHESYHDCLTSHQCIHNCTFCNQELVTTRDCGQIAGHSGGHVCRVDAHLCGQPCGLSGRQGCVDNCVKPVSHEGDHVCSAPVHTLPLPNERSSTL